MICPNCGKILNEGEICTCTASTEPVQAPVEPIQEAVQEPVQENAQEPVQEPVQAPTNEQPYYQPSENVIEPHSPQAESEPYQNQYMNQPGQPYYSPEQNNQYYAPTEQQIPYYAPVIMPSASTDYPDDYKPKKRYVAVLLAYALGIFGIHNFYLGNNSKAVAQILLTTLGSLLFGLGMVATSIWVIVETVQLLTEKVDSDANGYKIMTLAEEIAWVQSKKNK